MDQLKIPTPPPFPCIHCGRNLMAGDDFQYASILYGVFFLRGTADGYVGTTCPSCLNTTYINLPKNSFEKFVQSWSQTDFHGIPVLSNYSYYSPCISSPRMNLLFRDFQILHISNNFKSDEQRNNFFDFYVESEDYVNGEDYYCSFLGEMNRVVEPYFSVLWPTKEQVESLIKLEIEREKRVFPRYLYNNDLLRRTENFFWNHFYQYNLTAYLDEIYQHDEYMVYQHDVGLAKAYFKESIGNVDNSRKILDFHEILTSNDQIFPQINQNLKSLGAVVESVIPMLDTEKTTLFKERVVDENNEDSSREDLIEKLNSYKEKQYARDFLDNSACEFFYDYATSSISNSWSYAWLTKIKEKFFLLYSSAIDKGAKKEARYSFLPIGKSFKIKFDGKELPETDLTGFHYIYFLVCNRGFGFDALDIRKIIEKEPIVHMKKYHSLETEYGNDEQLNIKVEYSEYDAIDGEHKLKFSDEETLHNCQSHIGKLKNILDELNKETDAKPIKNIKKEIREIETYIKKNFLPNKKPKKIRGYNDQAKDTIGKSIKYAIEWIGIQGFNDAYSHFDESIKPYADPLVYNSTDENIRWHT